MLRSLYIRDVALIESLDIEFDDGLNIVTGETGAGKSILVGALKLILGDRASTDSVRPNARKAVVEGAFDLAEDSPVAEAVNALLEANDIDTMPRLILRREVSSVQSRAFINDTPATVGLLKEVAAELVDLHGQHEHQSLLRTERHLGLVDAFGGLQQRVEAYTRAHEEAKRIHARRQEVASRERALRKEKDMLAFQLEEIDRVAPKEGEVHELDAERRLLENSERLHESTRQLFEILYESEHAVNDLLVRARQSLQELARIDPAFEPINQEMITAQITVAEAANFLQDYQAGIEFNPDRLEEIRNRLMDLDRLSRKYGGTEEAVLAHRADIAERFELASDFEGALRRLDDEFNAACDTLSKAANRLSHARRDAADRIEALIVDELAELGMPDSRFKVEMAFEEAPDGWIRLPDGRQVVAAANGMDRGGFLISTNPGMEVMPLARVASGGEISRIMLALKSILAKSDRLPILIFDEIDTGISGITAQRVGDCMAALSRTHQIVAITHLPQVAACGATHYKVQKIADGGSTTTTMRRLSDDERVQELAGLLSGAHITDASLASARELLSRTTH